MPGQTDRQTVPLHRPRSSCYAVSANNVRDIAVFIIAVFCYSAREDGQSIVMSMSVCVCVSVCLFVRKRIPGTACPVVAKLLRMSPLVCRGSVLFWRRCDTLGTSGFVYDVMCAHNQGWRPFGAQSTFIR